MRIAEAAAATLRHDHFTPVPVQISQGFSCCSVADHRAHRDRNDQVGAVQSVHVLPLAMLAAGCPIFPPVAEVEQRVQVPRGPHNDVTALPSVAAVWPTARNELLPPETHTPAAAVTRLHMNRHIIDELHCVIYT